MRIKPEFYHRKEAERIAYRGKCVACANEFISRCAAIGVDIRIFGSLVDASAFFRANSDVDLCIMNDSPDFFKIESIALDCFKPDEVLFDLWRLEDLKPEVKTDVMLKGRKHAE